nr:hypothetical protein Itr_chr12CG15770 [Ipomoea trifida]GLL41979.1 hypothetical protein Itr_chr12CG15780 [Ipomoea trifida]
MITHHGHHRRRYATLSVVAGVSLAANVYQEARGRRKKESVALLAKSRDREGERERRGREDVKLGKVSAVDDLGRESC